MNNVIMDNLSREDTNFCLKYWITVFWGCVWIYEQEASVLNFLMCPHAFHHELLSRSVSDRKTGVADHCLTLEITM